MSEKRMYTMAATAMSTVSINHRRLLMTMLDAKFVVAALVLNMFSTFIVLSLVNPYDTKRRRAAPRQPARRPELLRNAK